MGNLKKILITGILLFMPYFMFGQDCEEILKKSCSQIHDKKYKKLSISRTAFVEVNKAILCTAVFPANKDYIIDFCSESKYKPIKIRLMDKKTNVVIYDNSVDNYRESIDFTLEDNPVIMIIEVTVASNNKDQDNYEVQGACSGFRIFFKKRSE
jgi:hypothetical protein